MRSCNHNHLVETETQMDKIQKSERVHVASNTLADLPEEYVKGRRLALKHISKLKKYGPDDITGSRDFEAGYYSAKWPYLKDLDNGVELREKV